MVVVADVVVVVVVELVVVVVVAELPLQEASKRVAAASIHKVLEARITP